MTDVCVAHARRRARRYQASDCRSAWSFDAPDHRADILLALRIGRVLSYSTTRCVAGATWSEDDGSARGRGQRYFASHILETSAIAALTRRWRRYTSRSSRKSEQS